MHNESSNSRKRALPTLVWEEELVEKDSIKSVALFLRTTTTTTTEVSREPLRVAKPTTGGSLNGERKMLRSKNEKSSSTVKSKQHWRTHVPVSINASVAVSSRSVPPTATPSIVIVQ